MSRRTMTEAEFEQALQWAVEGATARVLRSTTRSEAKRQMRGLMARVSAVEQHVLARFDAALAEQAAVQGE